MKKYAVILMWFMLANVFVPRITSAQSSALPNDLLLTAVDKSSNTIIGRVDPQTSQIVPFYTDSSATSLRALSWSPTGDMLAILRVQKGNTDGLTQICLLDRTGNLKLCFTDKAPDRNTIDDDRYQVTWSADEKHVYFVSGEGYKLKLIEATVATGLTSRALYQLPPNQDESNEVPIIGWTPTLDYVIVGAGSFNRATSGLPAFLVNLQTNVQTNLLELIPKADQKSFEFCADFSPSGKYIAGFNNGDVVNPTSGRRFVLFDKQGNVVKTIDKSNTTSIGEIPEQCPVWEKNEGGFYYNATDPTDNAQPRIARYDLNTGQISIYFQTSDVNQPLGTDLILSPDQKNLAFALPEAGYSTVIALSPNNLLQFFLKPYTSAENPLWIQPTPTIGDLHNKVSACVNDLGNSLNAKIDHQDWNPFINEVQAQIGKKIDQLCADQMIAIANYFINNPPATATPKK